jgi:hypothetical protein
MPGAFHYMMILRCDAGRLTYPLAYPDQDGEFYGYERWGILMTQGFVPGTRTLVNSTTLSATTLLALITGHQIGTKNQSIWEYKQYIGDEWADSLADV